MVPRYNSQTGSDSNDPSLRVMLVIERVTKARLFSCMHTL
jgi:hypothetical protein